MGILTNRVNKDDIKEGDHIYTYRAAFTYCHHGIFVGGDKVVHFTPKKEENSRTQTFRIRVSGMSEISVHCPASYPECEFNCGFRQPNSGVVLSCLSCFLSNGDLYHFEYGVSKSHFLTRLRGGTCTTAASDPPQTVIHRAMYLLQNGFGNFDVFENNCEDFALYCKTGLLIVNRHVAGSSGQASSVSVAPFAVLVAFSAKYIMGASPVGVAAVTAGTYCMSKYGNDIGVRKDVAKVAVENVAVILGRLDNKAR